MIHNIKNKKNCMFCKFYSKNIDGQYGFFFLSCEKHGISTKKRNTCNDFESAELPKSNTIYNNRKKQDCEKIHRDY